MGVGRYVVVHAVDLEFAIVVIESLVHVECVSGGYGQLHRRKSAEIVVDDLLLGLAEDQGFQCTDVSCVCDASVRAVGVELIERLSYVEEVARHHVAVIQIG